MLIAGENCSDVACTYMEQIHYSQFGICTCMILVTLLCSIVK